MKANDGLGTGLKPLENEVGRDGVRRRPLERSIARALHESGTGTSTDEERAVDSRVISALEAYLESLRAGRAWSPSEFLADRADVSPELKGCLSGLEFIEAAAAGLSGSPGHAATTQAESDMPPQSRLGDYHILREVGRGGMGIVYEALQISLGRRVALKVLPHSAAVDPKQRQRFQIEAQAAAQLQHPHIVPVFGVGCDAGIHYYAMQFVDGQSLSTIIRDLRSGDGELPSWAEPSEQGGSNGNGPASPAPAAAPGAGEPRRDVVPDEDVTVDLSPQNGVARSHPTFEGNVRRDVAFCRKVARLGTEAADALEHAHGLGVLHRDIKPANLLIDRDGSVWITDFGLARFSGNSSLTGTGDIIGTLRYMSPEQSLARRGVVDQRTDVYALGATLYEFLTLRPAFDGRDHQELIRQISLDEPTPLRRLNPAVPRELETIVLKAMAKDPSGRYATAQELSEDLKRFLNDDPIMGRRPGPVERTIRWARRRWELVATAAAIVMVSLSIGTGITWRQASETTRQANEAKEARNKYRDYLVKHFPLLDRAAREEVNQAVKNLHESTDPAVQRDAYQVYDQVLNLFQETSELPPTDIESRVVIARALCRLAYTRTMLSFQKGTWERPEPKLMAEAGADFRRSIDLFEKLMGEQGGDTVIRRYLADALGLNGMGCHLRFTHRPQEAEQFYRRAIELRRDLVRGTSAEQIPGARPQIDDPGAREDPLLLVWTVESVCMLRAQARSGAETEQLYKQLEDDFAVVATRFSGPEFRERRREWAKTISGTNMFFSDRDARRTMILHSRLALILDAENAEAHNNFAWALVNVPDDPWFDPKQGLVHARKALDLDSKNWMFWNTLGVAAFRDRDWTTAHDSLKKSINMKGGRAHDWFFLAMTQWNQGNRHEARQSFDLAVAALEKEPTDDPDVHRARAEAAALLGLPCPNAAPGVAGTGQEPAAPPGN